MLRTVVVRTSGALLTLTLASVAAFVILRLLPGDPARLIAGPLAGAHAIREERSALGLNQPIPVQYFEYVLGFIRGNWGFDYNTGQPVLTEVVARLPASLELGFYAMVLAMVGAAITALVSVGTRSHWPDTLCRAAAFLGVGSPPFWVGLLALLLFSELLHVLPGPTGRLSINTSVPPTITHFYTFDAVLAGQWGTAVDAFRHLVLPALTLGLAPFGYLYRLLRHSLLGVVDEEFLLVCQANGLTRWQALIRHALPNALFPVVTATGLLVAQLVAGSVLVETVFDWPGVGQLVVSSILVREYGVVEAFVVLSAIAFITVNLCVDGLYVLIDPRIRRPIDAP